MKTKSTETGENWAERAKVRAERAKVRVERLKVELSKVFSSKLNGVRKFFVFVGENRDLLKLTSSYIIRNLC